MPVSVLLIFAETESWLLYCEKKFHIDLIDMYKCNIKTIIIFWIRQKIIVWHMMLAVDLWKLDLLKFGPNVKIWHKQKSFKTSEQSKLWEEISC